MKGYHGSSNYRSATVNCGAGDDKIYGKAGNDSIDGGDGKDLLYGDSGNDTLTGGASDDSLWGGTGHDSLIGGNGADTLTGEKGNDKLFGGNGNDLLGGSGNDSLWGDAGNDSLSGGNAGADNFIYSDGEDKDVIYGFESNDLLQITGAFSSTYSKSKREVYFKVGTTSKAITLTNFSATSFNVNDDLYQISGIKLVKK